MKKILFFKLGAMGDILVLSTASDARDVFLDNGAGNLNINADATLSSGGDTMVL